MRAVRVGATPSLDSDSKIARSNVRKSQVVSQTLAESSLVRVNGSIDTLELYHAREHQYLRRAEPKQRFQQMVTTSFGVFKWVNLATLEAGDEREQHAGQSTLR